MNRKIDVFLPVAMKEVAHSLTSQLEANPIVRKIFPAGSMHTSEALRTLASQANALYTLLVTKPVALQLGEGALERMVLVANDSDAALVYADRYEQKAEKTARHPVIDYQTGSIRDDFDFGSVLLIRTCLLKQWAKAIFYIKTKIIQPHNNKTSKSL